jgi:hypothetical protein
MPRAVPGSNVTILATCPKGVAYDREQPEVDYASADKEGQS